MQFRTHAAARAAALLAAPALLAGLTSCLLYTSDAADE